MAWFKRKSAPARPPLFSDDAWDISRLPDGDTDFVRDADIAEFAAALAAPENSPSTDNLLSPTPTEVDVAAGARDLNNGTPRARIPFITALNDWRPVHQRVRKRRKKKRGSTRRGKDETREGFVYTLLKWPFLFGILAWLAGLVITYLWTRFYIWMYEHWVTWRGTRNRLRKDLRGANNYDQWVKAANALDAHLGSDAWKRKDEYAYYDSRTIRRLRDQLCKLRVSAEKEEKPRTRSNSSKSGGNNGNVDHQRPVERLRYLLEGCVKANFAGFENPHLYSETYFGTKDNVQDFIHELENSLAFLLKTTQLEQQTKHALFKRMHTNFGRTALCLSGGATFAYYHFGVAKALLDNGLLPTVITGTSGGALVASLLATRTDEELKRLLVPALANRITACQDDVFTWFTRWMRTGARFDGVDWAKKCAWFTRGSLTFREAYERTGRILNVTCVPSDPHSPTILANYLTSPDCVVWSAVLASAAVPGILNPVVLMRKNVAGELEPWSFGHKWKDGSLRTDIPLKALNLHFNVRFPVVSQANPHVNLFFFSSRGSVGRPVTHRRGRGWRGGFLGSATEQYLKLDLTKWLKVLRHLELLPRLLGQDWSELWLQRFSGTVTIHPRASPSDLPRILTDPTQKRLAQMLREGQLATFPKLNFMKNRMSLEKLLERGRRSTRAQNSAARKASQDGSGGEKLLTMSRLGNVLSEEDLQGLLRNYEARSQAASSPRTGMAERMANHKGDEDDAVDYFDPGDASSSSDESHRRLTPLPSEKGGPREDVLSPTLGKRIKHWFSSISPRPDSPSSAAGDRRSPIPDSMAIDGGNGNSTSVARNTRARTRKVPEIDRPQSMFELGSPPPNALNLQVTSPDGQHENGLVADSPASQSRHRGGWLGGGNGDAIDRHGSRRSSFLTEMERQSAVFFDDESGDSEHSGGSDGMVGEEDEGRMGELLGLGIDGET